MRERERQREREEGGEKGEEEEKEERGEGGGKEREGEKRRERRSKKSKKNVYLKFIISLQAWWSWEGVALMTLFLLHLVGLSSPLPHHGCLSSVLLPSR